MVRNIGVLFLSIFLLHHGFEANSCLAAGAIEGTPVVAAKVTADPEIKKAADDLALLFGQKKAVLMERNPVCCYWVDIDPLLVSLNLDCYVIICGPEGAVIRGSNVKQTLLAVERFKAECLTSDGNVKKPDSAIFSNQMVKPKNQ